MREINANNLVYNILTPQNISAVANYQSIKMFVNILKEKHMQIILYQKSVLLSQKKLE